MVFFLSKRYLPVILAIMLISRSLKQAEHLAVKRIHQRANEH